MLSGKKTALDYFRKQPDPKELVRKWQSEIRAEQRAIERQIREIQRDEKLAQKQCRESAKRGDMASARLLARELVHTKKVIGRMYVNKAHMVSMNAQLAEQLGVAKVAGTLSRSTEVMKLVNDLIRVPQLNATMAMMSREMMKAGVIDEMVSDMMDSAMDGEDLDEEADEEVDKVLQEIAGETLSQLPGARVPQTWLANQAAAPSRQEEEEEDLQARLNAVRS